VLEIEGGAVTAYEGDYEDYLRRKAALAAAPLAEAAAEKLQQPQAPWDEPATISPNHASSHTDAASGARPRRLNPIRQKQMVERCAFLEEEIPRIESAIAHSEDQLAVYVSAAETQRLTVLAAELRAQLAALTGEWEELTAQLERQTT